MNIKWNKVANIEKSPSFLQIDKISNTYILSYSYSPAISGGFTLKRIDCQVDSLKEAIMFTNDTHTISCVKVEDSRIGFVRYDFELHKINSTLLVSKDMGAIWDTVSTPFDNIRRFEFTSIDGMLIEGNKGGTTQVYQRKNDNSGWEQIDFLKLGFSNVSLLDKIDSEKILLYTETNGLFSKHQLSIYNINDGTIQKVIDFDNRKNDYIKLYSTNGCLYAVVKGDNTCVYEYKNQILQQMVSFDLPDNTLSVKNLFLNDKLYIITCQEKGLQAKELSWISYDKGGNWKPFYQSSELRLVYNTFGSLIIINKGNEVMSGVLKE